MNDDELDRNKLSDTQRRRLRMEKAKKAVQLVEKFTPAKGAWIVHPDHGPGIVVKVARCDPWSAPYLYVDFSTDGKARSWTGVHPVELKRQLTPNQQRAVDRAYEMPIGKVKI